MLKIVANIEIVVQSSTIYHHVFLVNIGATARCCGGFGQGSGQIVLDQLNCIGTETSLFNCPANPIGSHNCVHSEDVGVTCQRMLL